MVSMDGACACGVTECDGTCEVAADAIFFEVVVGTMSQEDATALKSFVRAPVVEDAAIRAECAALLHDAGVYL